MLRLVSRVLLALMAAAAFGALLWGCAKPQQSPPPAGPPAPTAPQSGGGVTPGPARQGLPTGPGGGPREQMRAWVQSSLDSLGIGLQLPIPENQKGKGVPVATVRAGSPAQRGGLRAGDTIVSFDSTSVGSPKQLAELVAKAQPTTRYAVIVERGGKRVTLQVSGVRPSKLSRPAMTEGSGRSGGGGGGISFGP